MRGCGGLVLRGSRVSAIRSEVLIPTATPKSTVPNLPLMSHNLISYPPLAGEDARSSTLEKLAWPWPLISRKR